MSKMIQDTFIVVLCHIVTDSLKLNHSAFYPTILSHSWIWVTALSTLLTSLVKRIMAASSTSNMGSFSCKLTH